MKRLLTYTSLITGMLITTSVLAQTGNTQFPSSPVSETEVRVQLTPQDHARLLSRMSGVIVEVPVRDGAQVSQGDILARFDCAEREQRADQARARKVKQDGLASSAKKLADLGSGSIIDLRVREAEKAEADAQYEQMKTEAGYCQIVAPFDGRVAVLSVEAYQTVRENDQIAEVIQDETLEAEMIVPSRWLAWLKPGQVFRVLIDETGKRYPAEVTHIGGRVDPVSQSVKIYGRIQDRAPELLAGMSGIAELAPPEPAAPEAAPPKAAAVP
jgi:RND family efflux transporter MFP subunit